MTGHVWLDGRLVPAGLPHLFVSDRGFALGDGVFETLRTRRGVPIEWDEHLARLRHSAAALAIRLPVDATRLRDGVSELLAADGLDAVGDAARPPGDAAIRITLSRGPLAARGTLPTGWQAVTATVAIQAWPHVPPPVALLARGITAVTSTVRRDPSHPLATIKTTSRAELVAAQLEAVEVGADEALLLTHDGRFAEATSANLFMIAGGVLATPSTAAGILHGVTRAWLLADAAARGLGLRPVERDVGQDDLTAADEAFLASSIGGIVPLTRLDGRPIGTGTPGPRTLRLRELREAWIDTESLRLRAS